MKKSLLLITIFYVCLLHLSDTESNGLTNRGWPTIVPVTKSFYFLDASIAAAKLDIVGLDGKPLYTIECHTYNYRDPEFDYSGDFECRLKSLYSADAHSTLFSDLPKQTRDWQSRGRFLVQEIIGKCADYPEHGRIRHFRLRGMEITLTIRNPKFGEIIGMKKGRPELKSFEFDIIVKTDPNSIREIAEPVPYIEPPFVNPSDPNDFTLNCDTILVKEK